MPGRPKSTDSGVFFDLITKVKNHALLYDKNNEDHSNRAKKAEAWKTIGSELNLSGEACKRNFKGLRDKYCKQLKAIRYSKGPESAVDWLYMDAMKFLKHHIVHTGKLSNTERSSPVSKQASVHKSSPPQKKAVFKKRVPVHKSIVRKQSTGKKSDKLSSCSPIGKEASFSLSPTPDSMNLYNQSGVEDNIVHEEEEIIPDEADTIHEEHNGINDNATATQTSSVPSQAPVNIITVTDSTDSVPLQVRRIVDTLEALLLSSVESSKQLHDDAYYFGMNIACRLRQLTRKNMSIAQAEIQYRLRQIELENEFL